MTFTASFMTHEDDDDEPFPLRSVSQTGTGLRRHIAGSNFGFRTILQKCSTAESHVTTTGDAGFPQTEINATFI